MATRMASATRSRSGGNGGQRTRTDRHVPVQPPEALWPEKLDTVWDAEGQEYQLLVGWEGTVVQVVDRTWTTHVMVDFKETGVVGVGWDVLTKVEDHDGPNLLSIIEWTMHVDRPPLSRDQRFPARIV